MGAYLVRSFRWVVFLRPTRRRLPPLYLLGTRVIGFTAVALLGRVADLAPPYLVARRSEASPSPLQVAIYTVERMFDAYLHGNHRRRWRCCWRRIKQLCPTASWQWQPAKRRIARSKCILIVLAVAVRLAGEKLARALRDKPWSHKLGAAVAAKIRGFRDGLVAVSL